jgi:hypothetical protein
MPYLSDATSKFRATLLNPERKTSGIRALTAAWVAAVVASEPSSPASVSREGSAQPRLSPAPLQILSHILRVYRRLQQTLHKVEIFFLISSVGEQHVVLTLLGDSGDSVIFTRRGRISTTPQDQSYFA